MFQFKFTVHATFTSVTCTGMTNSIKSKLTPREILLVIILKQQFLITRMSARDKTVHTNRNCQYSYHFKS